MRVLVTGCNGLLGQKCVELRPNSVDVWGVDLHEKGVVCPADCYRSLNLTDRSAVHKQLEEWRPQWIINAAAYTHVDRAEAERELCWNANVTAVENLVYAARKIGARVVHISTDYVFDGKNGPYREEDLPNPQGFYSRSKLASENVLRSSTIKFAIVRTMVLYGLTAEGRPNFVTWVIDELSSGRTIRIVTDQIGNTTLADELALGLWKIIDEDASGIYHIAGRELIDRFSFARLIAEIFALDNQLILPITTAELHQAAPRPLNSGLVVDKAMQQLGIELSDARGGLLTLKKQVESFSARSKT